MVLADVERFRTAAHMTSNKNLLRGAMDFYKARYMEDVKPMRVYKRNEYIFSEQVSKRLKQTVGDSGGAATPGDPLLGFSDKDQQGHVGGKAPGEEGLRRWTRWEYLMESGLPYPPYGFQRKFLNTIKPSIAPFIFGKQDWAIHRARLCRERGWDPNASKLAMAIAARRVGKSILIGRICVATALVCPGSKQAIFSTGKRASGNMLQIIHDILLQAGLQHLVIKKNQEKLVLRGETPNEYREISSYPSRAKISIFEHHHHPIIVLLLFFSLLS